jgi:hypothetical protein
MEATAADEAILVQPPQLRVSDDPDARMAYLLSPFRPDDEESVRSARERAREVAKRAHAYVSTDRWREAVVRTYTFLDQHKDVRDVVVQPIAADGATEMEIFSAHGVEEIRGETRVYVADLAEAQEILGRVGVELPAVRVSSILFVPVVGSGMSVNPTPGNLPSAWMTVHALFDGSDKERVLPTCARVEDKISRIIFDQIVGPFNTADIGVLPLLFNCGWSENAFNMAIAAHRKGGSDFRRVLEDEIPSPPVGRRYRSPESVPVRPHPRPTINNGLNYVARPLTDLVSEVMTIAVTKPEGVQLLRDRLGEVPDELFLQMIKRKGMEHMFNDIVPEEEISSLSAPLPESVRHRAESHVANQMKDVIKLTRNLRDLLVKDLAGKAVFVSVH